MLTFKHAVAEYLDDNGCPCVLDMWGVSGCEYYDDCHSIDRQYVDGILSVEHGVFEPCEECKSCPYLEERTDLLYDYGYEGDK